MKTIAVWFSCGAASAVAAKLTIEKYGKTHIVRVVNNPVKEEDEDNRRFLHDVEKWLGQEIELATNSRYPSCSTFDVFKKRRYISGNKGAPCTGELKKEARYQWESRNKVDHHVMGYTVEEQWRHDDFYNFESPFILPVLIEAGLTKDDCGRIIQDAGIKLPRVYFMASRFGTGYPNANCIGCVKASSATYWNHVRETAPERFKELAELSRDIGCKLTRRGKVDGVNANTGERIYLDELHPDAKGRSMKSMKIDCGIVCATGKPQQSSREGKE